ncbi:MAG: radical SAM protein [Coriobacteriia bacterium]|nr:radical SAM protein [Coriobacteriia bacterium]
MKFNSVYIESGAIKHKRTSEILQKIDYKKIIEVDHYKDVFCRPRQNYYLQHKNQNLILAVKHDNFLYPGAEVCQDFGYNKFYWCSSVMNCICDCEYCYLKGMYPSGNLVVYVNLEDYFKNIHDKKYICVSYDTDLFPLESTLGYIEKWCDFAKSYPDITLEIRTKCKNLSVWKMEAPTNVIFAFSVSPDSIIKMYEHKTSSLAARIENFETAQNCGFRTRLCIDPIIYCADWKEKYSEMMGKIDVSKFEDISVGSFRISQQYLKNMRKYSESKLVNFPFKNVNGYYQYEPELQASMEEYVCSLLPRNKVFLWK